MYISRSGFPRRWALRVSWCLAFGACLFISGALWAQERIVQLPEGGVPTRVLARGFICGPIPPGWALESDGKTVTPPRQVPEGTTRHFGTRVAESPGKCADSQDTLTLVVTGRWPYIDPSGVQFYPGEGRVELQGLGLEGVQVVSPDPEARAEGGEGRAKDRVEACLEPTETEKNKKKQQLCAVPVSRQLPADVRLQWLPAFAHPAPDAVLYDAAGNRAERETFLLKPARVVLPSRLVTRDGIDVAQGPGTVPLAYPEAVASVECGTSRCEIVDRNVVLRGINGPDAHVTMRLRLGPRMFVRGNNGLEQELTLKLPLLSCPVEVVSGPVLRDVSSPRIIVRMEPGCGSDAGELHWSVAGADADVEQVLKKKDGVFLVLHAERITRERVTITATRRGLDTVVVGSANHTSVPAPRPRAAVELPGHGRIDFIPTNRDAAVAVNAIRGPARFVLLPIEGAYDIKRVGDKVFVRGDDTAGGFASLQFAYRVAGLPPELVDTNLAILPEAVQRQVRQASVPAPFAAQRKDAPPLVEFVCVGKHGQAVKLIPGKPFRIPFEARESCRVIIHRENLNPEDGMQEVVLDVDVTSAEGAARPQARISERMVLRPAPEPKVFWVRGGVEQFDRIVVRVAHVVDEERYVISPTLRAGLPSLQWSAIVEGGRFRLYATAAIPAGLFRVTEPSGQLRLNFGVLSRLTMLDELGRESLFGLELGVMGVGLISDSQSVSGFPPTLAAVAGLGVRVPLGQGAAVGVHAWLSYEFRDDIIDDMGKIVGSHWAFIFGPSISVGNAGKNL